MLLVFRKFIDLSNEVRNIISQLLSESSVFNANDVLVDAKNDHRALHFLASKVDTSALAFPLSEFPKRILSDARTNMKESGVNTLCLAHGLLELELNGRIVQSPVLLIPLSVAVDRIQQRVTFQMLEDTAFVNPFILNHFRKVFDLNLPNELVAEPQMESLVSFFTSKQLHVDSTQLIIGNFHHHRYDVLKELEELLEAEVLNPSIGALFGKEAVDLPEINLKSTHLFPADTDQERVFASVERFNTVVQGPPGTGKSQVICNLIGKALTAEHTLLVVSEKRVALEVIQAKLAQLGLDRLSFVAGSDRQSHDFLHNLKSTWDFFESYEPTTEINLQLSEQHEDHLQMTLDLLSQPNLIGGISFHDFQAQRKEKHLDSIYSSTAPTISRFLEHRSITHRIFELELSESVSFLRKSTLSTDNFLTLDRRIETWNNQLSALRSVFPLDTWNDLSRAMQTAAICQIFENDLFKQYAAIFVPDSKEQKQFLRLAKQYFVLSETPEIGSEWKQYPSLQEAHSLGKQLKEGNFFERNRAKKRWKQLSHLPISHADESLKKRIDAAKHEEKLAKCIARLKKLGVHQPATEVALIQQSLSVYSAEKWTAYSSIPAEERTNMTAHHAELSALHHDLYSTFKFAELTPVSRVLEKISSQFSRILAERQKLLLLDESELISLRGCADFSTYEALVYGSNWTLFKERFPAFSDFEPKEMKLKVDAILNAQATEAKVHAKHLLNGIRKRFDAYHLLLNTPASKLNSEQKELKTELRKGKSILVKEFSKTRSHPSLRELFNSEARHWITLLKPIWLSNPSSLAKSFPMDQLCFDFVIFDEASQLPVQHALGAIQRSRRMVIAGDEHQMGPSSYFQSGSEEVIDLLHQASYHFPKIPLLHHYRSAHPELIAFSNKHFYDGKLTAYPSAQRNQHPIFHHFVEGATFENRINTIEARAIAARVPHLLSEKESIGIVAFSEEQLNCIQQQLDPHVQEALIAHQETHGGFMKALENVQGDECDHLIIGFGYAPNPEGDFHLRFGPMNTHNGRKRLNVLLTRARKSIDFFCSVRSSNFKLSDNESINLLRQWIAFSEQQTELNAVEFPYGLQPEITGSTLIFHRIQEKLPQAREIATLQAVLESRGWRVEYA